MTTVGLEVGVFVLLRVEIGAQIIIVLDEEVGLANANPEEVGILGKQTVNLLVTVGIDFRVTIRVGLLLVDGGREQANVAEEVGIIDGDEEAVETTHRQTGNGAVGLVLLDAVGLLDELYHVGECRLETSLHRLW